MNNYDCTATRGHSASTGFLLDVRITTSKMTFDEKDETLRERKVIDSIHSTDTIALPSIDLHVSTSRLTVALSFIIPERKIGCAVNNKCIDFRFPDSTNTV